MSEFARLLKENRDALGITQKDLAKKAEINHTYISHLEAGSPIRPSKNVASALARALGLNDGERRILLSAAGFVEKSEDAKIAELEMELPADIRVLPSILRDQGLREDEKETLIRAIAFHINEFKKRNSI